MARPGVEYDDVARVAQQLISQGNFPSVQKVRQLLGTGSHTTINTHLKTWQAKLAASNKPPVLPESVPQDLISPLDEFWTLALTKAEANYQQYKEELEAKVVTAEAAQHAAEATLADKIGELNNLQDTYKQLEQQFRDMEKQWYTLQGQHAVATGELSQAHTALDQAHALLRSHQEAFESQREQLTQAHAKALHSERERSTQTETRLLQDIDHLRQSIKTAETERNKQLKATLEITEQSHQRELNFRQELAELAGRLKQTEKENTDLQQRFDENKQHVQLMQGQISTSLATVEALRQALDQSKANELVLTEQNGQLNAMIAQLQSTKRSEDHEHTKQD